jgi:hypothetical protein
MKINDKQLGKPEVLYRNTRTSIEGLTGIDEGSIAYSTDIKLFGVYSGSSWMWGASGSVTIIESSGSGGISRSGSSADNHLVVWNGSNVDSVKDGGVIPTGGGGGGTVVRDKLYDVILGSSGTFSASSISSSYDHLELIGSNLRSAVSGTADNIKISFNDDTTSSNYRYQFNTMYTNSTAYWNGDDYIIGDCCGNTSPANAGGFIEAHVPNYSGGYLKILRFDSTFLRDSTTNYLYTESGGLNWSNTSAITKIVISSGNGNFVAGSRFQIWGIKET